MILIVSHFKNLAIFWGIFGKIKLPKFDLNFDKSINFFCI